MNDNEATVMRLTEQAKILKEEIRRLERNVERENETKNLEYLKNILLKVGLDFSFMMFDFEIEISMSIFVIHVCNFSRTDERAYARSMCSHNACFGQKLEKCNYITIFS